MGSAKMTSGIYQPLDKEQKEIRILEVEPGSGAQPISCNMKTTSLTANPTLSYETISYHWGDARIRASIVLNGITTDVPASAEIALRRMRLAHTKRILWIDAICINQKDIVERGHQVGMMYEIYSKTVGNLIWLGEDDGTTKGALDAMDMVLEDARKETKDFETLNETLRDAQRRQRDASHGLATCVELDSLRQFFSRTWFTRLWVSLS